MNSVFYLSAAVAIVSTLLMITRLNAVHALLYLILSLLSVAVIFYISGAPFAAGLELIIYAGGHHGPLHIRRHAAEPGGPGIGPGAFVAQAQHVGWTRYSGFHSGRRGWLFIVQRTGAESGFTRDRPQGGGHCPFWPLHDRYGAGLDARHGGAGGGLPHGIAPSGKIGIARPIPARKTGGTRCRFRSTRNCCSR